MKTPPLIVNQKRMQRSTGFLNQTGCLCSIDGYSLIEVLIASAILLIGITAAACMIHAMSVQEATDARIMQALNMQEQAARLWQMGITTNQITNVLPAKFSADDTPGDDEIYLGFTGSTTNLGGSLTNVETLDPLRLIFVSGYDGSTPVYRTNNVLVTRPTPR